MVYNGVEVIHISTLGERLKHARKSRGFTQNSLADAIGVSRGVIYNIEKDKTDAQVIVTNAICHILKINNEWLIKGGGNMEENTDAKQSAKTLTELYEVVKDLSEQEQLYLLDTIKALKKRLGKASGAYE